MPDERAPELLQQIAQRDAQLTAAQGKLAAAQVEMAQVRLLDQPGGRPC